MIATNQTLPPTQDVFEIVFARPVLSEDFTGGVHPALVHLWWRAPDENSRVVQIYLNDEHIDTTSASDINNAWITLDLTQPHRIELLAVDPREAWLPMPQCLNTWQPRIRDTLTRRIVRDENLPLDTRIDIKLDNQPDRLTELFPGDQPRGGFGAIFSTGGFGTDNATGPGLGRGELGFGPLGSDGNADFYTRNNLDSAQAHTLTIDLTDPLDRSVITTPVHEILTFDPLPPEPTQLQISPTPTTSTPTTPSAPTSTPTLTLTWESNDA